MATSSVRVDRPDRRASRERTQQRMRQRYDTIQQLATQGMTISAIARAVGLHRHTVQKYVRLPAPPARRHVWRHPSVLAPYERYLLERWRSGGRNAMALWRELVARGFAGKYRTVARLVAQWKHLDQAGAPVPPPPPGLTPRQATALLLLRPNQRSVDEQRAVDQVRTVHPEVHTAMALFDRFADLLRTGRRDRPATATERKDRLARLARLAQWMTDAARGGPTELTAFVTKLRQDRPAVENGLTLPYSQGQTEGQITRLKALKRQMFGRANFDLLRKRFLAATPAAAST